MIQLNCALLPAAQSASAAPRSIVSPAARLSEPALFELAEGESIKISPEGPTGFDFDVFVYDAELHELVGRSDDEATTPYFQWTAAKAGKYSVVLRNVSAIDGRGIALILPRGSKGVGDSKDGDLALVEVAYATDRPLGSVSGKGKSTIQNYGSDPDPNEPLHYGIANISIPRAHRMGELESVSILRLEFSEDKEKHVVLKEAHDVDLATFKTTLTDRMQKSQDHDVLVFVHGFNTRFEDGLRRAAQIKYDLNFGGVMIFYSWPSHGSPLLTGYNQDGRNAELSVPHFRQFLDQVAHVGDVRTIHVIAHSMGNRVVMRALAEKTDDTKIHVRHIALMAPDIDAALFQQLVVSMKSAADEITLYASSKDGALRASELLAGYRRAGEGGPNLIVMPGVLETIDASDVDTSLLGFNHSYFADNGTILSDLYRWIRGDPAEKRFGLTEGGTTKKKYWIFAARAR